MQPSILITGASSGIGKSLVQVFSQKNYMVFAGVRSAEDTSLMLSEFPLVHTVLLDITREEDINRGVKYIQDFIQGRGLDVLVNNAGIAVSGSFESLDIAEYHRQFAVNVFGTMQVTKAFLPLLKKSCGYIVTIGSVSGFFSMPYMSPYTMSKHALEAFSDTLRIELQSYGIRTILVEPGMIKTSIWDKAIHDIVQHSECEESTPVPAEKSMLKMAKIGSTRGISSDIVAYKVFRAVQKKHPKARILVGRDAYFLAFSQKFLPASVREKIIASYLGISNYE